MNMAADMKKRTIQLQNSTESRDRDWGTRGGGNLVRI